MSGVRLSFAPSPRKVISMLSGLCSLFLSRLAAAAESASECAVVLVACPLRSRASSNVSLAALPRDYMRMTGDEAKRVLEEGPQNHESER